MVFTIETHRAMQARNPRKLTLENLLHLGRIPPSIRKHLVRVYVSLCLLSLSWVLGLCSHSLFNTGGKITVLGFVGSMAWFYFTPNMQKKKKVSFLIAAVFFKGASIGFVIDPFVKIDKGIIVGALVGIAMVFSGFALPPLFTEKRYYIYCLAMAFSSLLIVFVWDIAPFIFGSIVKNLQLGIVFLWFLGYLLMYSQEMVEQARSRNYNYPQDSLSFFTGIYGLHLHVGHLVLQRYVFHAIPGMGN